MKLPWRTARNLNRVDGSMKRAQELCRGRERVNQRINDNKISQEDQYKVIILIKAEFLNPKFSRLLCNSFIQPRFDYTCISWYPLINQKIRNKLQVTQNEFIRFCLKLNSRQHIGAREFKKINWLLSKRKSRRTHCCKGF